MITIDKTKVSRGEIWFAELEDDGISGEQYGSRPVLIIQDDNLNNKLSTVVVATMTSNIENEQFCHIPIHLRKPSIIQLEQIKTISKKRLVKKAYKLNNFEMYVMEERLLQVLGLSTALEG